MPRTLWVILGEMRRTPSGTRLFGRAVNRYIQPQNNHPMKTRTSLLRRVVIGSCIEPLEARIAPASVVSLTGGNLSVVDGANLVDTITISTTAVDYVFSDPNGITAGSGANAINGNTVTVPIANVSGRFDVMTNGGNDSVTFVTAFSLPGDLTVDTGLGLDSITISGPMMIGGHAGFTSSGTINFNNAMTVGLNKNLTATTVANGTGVGRINLSNANADLTAQGSGSISLISVRDITLNPGSSVTTVDGSLSLSANASGSASGTFDGVVLDGATLASGTGNITVAGKGGATSGAGILYSATTTTIFTGGNGAITMTGFGSGSDGISMENAAHIVQTQYGAISITGATNTNAAGVEGISFFSPNPNEITIRSTGSGNITIFGGSQGGPVDMLLDGVSVSSLGGGDISLITDALSLAMASTTISTAGTVAIKQITGGRPIDLGTYTPGSLSITDLGPISAGTLQIGDVASGAITVSAAITYFSSLTLTTGDLIAIDAAGGLDVGGNALTLIAAGSIVVDPTAPFVAAATLFLSAAGDIGSAVAPFKHSSQTLSTSAGGSQYLVEFDTVNVVSFGAEASNIHLIDGIFVATSAAIIPFGSNLTVDGALDLNGFNLTANGLSGAGLLLNNGPSSAVFTSGGAANTTFDGALLNGASPLSFTKSGTGTLILTGLTGASSNTGPTTVSGGILEYASDLPISGNSLVLAGGTVRYNLPAGFFGSDPRAIVLAANATIEVTSVDGFSLNGTVSGAGFDFRKAGSGTLVSYATTFTARQINILAGALATGTSTSLGNKIPIDVAQNATFAVLTTETINNPLTFHGGSGGSSSEFAGLGALFVSDFEGNLGSLTGSIFLASGNSAFTGNIAINGAITGPGILTKVGFSTLVLKNAQNSFGPGTLSILGGALEVRSDGALGNAANVIGIFDSTLRTIGTFTIARDLVANGAVPTIEVASGTLTLTGSIGGTGTLMKTGVGTLLFGGNFTGTTTVSPGSGALSVGGSRLTVAGTGDAMVTVMPDGMGGTIISAIVLSNTTSATVLAIAAPRSGGTITVDKISSPDPAAEIGAIKFGKGVILGDGTSDGPDIDIAGKLGKLAVQDVAAGTIIRLGYGLTYNNPGDDTSPDTYNNHPDISIKSILGTGVIIDVTGDGMPGDEGGVGGGGLGKVVIDSWAFPGTIRTTQSIVSYKVKHGDSLVVFELDKFGVGTLTEANIGSISIPNGSWGSSGSYIEGNIGSFSAASFLAGATLTAGGMAKLKLNGDFAGTVTLTDPDAPQMKTFTVKTNFSGGVFASGSIKNVKVKGIFAGSLVASSIGSITAFDFIGTTAGDAIFGDATRQDIVATNGSLGTLITTAGTIRDYEIVASTVFGGFKIKSLSSVGDRAGLDNVFVRAAVIGNTSIAVNALSGTVLGTRDTIFSSTTTIGNITSTHDLLRTTIAAGSDLGKVTIGTAAAPAALTDSLLLAGIDLGLDGVFGGSGANLDAFSRAGKIASITVTGAATGSSIAAGVNPGPGFIFGDGDDVASPGSAPSGSAKSIGAIKLGAATGVLTPSPASPHFFAIEGASISSLALGNLAAVKAFATAGYLRFGAIEAASDLAVRLV